MKLAEKQELLVALGSFIADEMKKASAPLLARIAALEAKSFPYRGVHQRSNDYRRGEFTTYKGSIWYCCAETTQQVPGAGADWLLAVKGND